MKYVRAPGVPLPRSPSSSCSHGMIPALRPSGVGSYRLVSASSLDEMLDGSPVRRDQASLPAHIPQRLRPVRCRMYDSYMIEVAVSDARNRLADVIEEARRSGEPISVTRRGKRVAVIVESEAFDRLVDAADDAEDRRDLEAARADDDYVPWDEVKAALGLA